MKWKEQGIKLIWVWEWGCRTRAFKIYNLVHTIGLQIWNSTNQHHSDKYVCSHEAAFLLFSFPVLTDVILDIFDNVSYSRFYFHIASVFTLIAKCQQLDQTSTPRQGRWRFGIPIYKFLRYSSPTTDNVVRGQFSYNYLPPSLTHFTASLTSLYQVHSFIWAWIRIDLIFYHPFLIFGSCICLLIQ